MTDIEELERELEAARQWRIGAGIKTRSATEHRLEQHIAARRRLAAEDAARQAAAPPPGAKTRKPYETKTTEDRRRNNTTAAAQAVVAARIAAEKAAPDRADCCGAPLAEDDATSKYADRHRNHLTDPCPAAQGCARRYYREKDARRRAERRAEQ